MRAQNFSTASRPSLLLMLAAIAAGVFSLSGVEAQERRERERPDPPPAETPREREREGDGGRRVAPRVFEEEGDREGTPEGMPQARIAPPGGDVRPHILPRQWLLGVHAYNTPSGVVITQVLPGSPASEAGLERGDVIVTVDGFQVGYVDGRLYTLGEELQHRAGPRGEVRLLVQNVRNRRLVNLDVGLERDADFYRPFPRERP